MKFLRYYSKLKSYLTIFFTIRFQICIYNTFLLIHMIIFSTVEQSLEKKPKYLNHILLIQKLSLNLKLTAVKAVSDKVKQQINFLNMFIRFLVEFSI